MVIVSSRARVKILRMAVNELFLLWIILIKISGSWTNFLKIRVMEFSHFNYVWPIFASSNYQNISHVGAFLSFQTPC